MYSDIFNIRNCLGLAYCKTVNEFDEKFNYLKSTWGANDGLRAFLTYFECFKAKNFRYVIKGLVDKTGIVDVTEEDKLFTTNSAECINNFIKAHSSREKLDPYDFAIDLENLLDEEESNVLRCCIG